MENDETMIPDKDVSVSVSGTAGTCAAEERRPRAAGHRA